MGQPSVVRAVAAAPPQRLPRIAGRDRAALGPALRSVSPARDLGFAQRLLRAARDIPRVVACHPGFPSPYVRTNAFLIERELLLSLQTGRLGTKSAAYRFESGHGGMTEQLRARGLKPLMVGRGGSGVGAGALA